MYISRLALTNVRNYRQLELRFQPGPIVLCGENGQGKSNLLEAAFALAQGRPYRATLEREVVCWDVMQDDLPFARIEGTVHRRRGDARIELVFQVSRQAEVEGGQHEGGYTHKRIRVNGAVCRTTDLVGECTAVLFAAEDIELVPGSPSVRRKYVDLLNSQVSKEYLGDLVQYTRVVTQRNHLLRAVQEGEAREGDLEVWDTELVKWGVPLLAQRRSCITALADYAREAHTQLVADEGPLALVYQPNLAAGQSVNTEQLQGLFESRLAAARKREIAAGMTLVGPHRDELRFLIDGRDMGTYGSRGQHRTITLAMKLAEARYIEQATGDAPVLLLDDVLAELDAHRGARLQEAVLPYQQVLVTATDVGRFSPAFLAQAAKYRVANRRVEAI
ncbi:MAG: DNA replication/repair protein RecF [Chloroflexi bacterium]|nr:DNA replication/repair protein RecF [Chloroflexota bacterium]